MREVLPGWSFIFSQSSLLFIIFKVFLYELLLFNWIITCNFREPEIDSFIQLNRLKLE